MLCYKLIWNPWVRYTYIVAIYIERCHAFYMKTNNRESIVAEHSGILHHYWLFDAVHSWVVCMYVCVSVCVCLCFGREGGTPLRHGHKESYKKVIKFYLRVGLEPTTSWIIIWCSNHWAIGRSDESSLGIVRCTIVFTKFNHLYLGTGCVCFFWEGRGGGHPLVWKPPIDKLFTDRVLGNSSIEFRHINPVVW